MTMRVLIVDDEPIARRRISRLLKLEDDVEVVDEVGSGADAVTAIKEMHPGDHVFVYHSGLGVVGLAVVRSDARPDPKNPKSAVVDFEYAGRLDPPTTLAEIKQSKLFEDWALVRQGRLSTMSAPDKFVDWMRERYPKARI